MISSPSVACNLEELPSLPQAAARILGLLRDPEVSISELARALELEPVLAVKILKFANSAFVGCNCQVVDLRRALMIMGLRTAKITTLGFCLTNSFPRTDAFDFDWCWRRNIINSSAARKLSRLRPDIDSDNAFLAGLIQDMGILVLGQSLGSEYQPLIEACQAGEPMHLVEQRELQTDHAEVSAELSRHWGLPEEITVSVAEHHQDPVGDGLAAVLAGAEAVTNFVQDNSPENLLTYRQAVAALRLPEHAADDFVHELEPLTQELSAVLEIDFGNERTFAQLLAEAQRQLVSMSMQVVTDLSENQREARRLRRENKSLVEEVHRDGLTGLANRRRFDEALARSLRQRADQLAPLTLVLCDLDHFKAVNDTFGHLVGDEVLRLVARILQKNTRQGEDIPCRYGGEELAIIANDLSPEEARRLADRLRAKIAEHAFPCEGYPERVTASFGVVTLESDREVSAGKMIQLADACLYEAKQQGRNRVRWACI